MRINVSLSLSSEEKRAIRRNVIPLLELISEFEDTDSQEKIKHAIGHIGVQGTNIGMHHLLSAIEGMNYLTIVLTEMSQWGEKEWASCPLVLNPKVFSEHQSKLRLSQLLEVEEATEMLENAKLRLIAVQQIAQNKSDHDDAPYDYDHEPSHQAKDVSSESE